MRSGGTDTNYFRYCGEYWDTETETYYLRARYYDPVLGRFTQKDTYRGDHKDPLSLNLYVYCGNNPIFYLDYTGNAWEIVWDIGSAAYSGYVYYKDPTFENYIAYLFDVSAIFIPFIPAVGAVRIVDDIPYNQIKKFVDGVDATSDLTRSTKYIISSIHDTSNKAFKSYNSKNFRENLSLLTDKNYGKNFEAHHIFPQKFETYFDKFGIHINEPWFGTWVESNTHRKWSYAYNKAWDDFFHMHENPTYNDVIDYVVELSKEFAFDLNFKIQ